MVTGCKEKSINCNIGLENESLNYTLNGDYKVYYKKSYVTKIEKTEVFKSNDNKTLDYLYESKRVELESLNDKYGGYSYDISVDKKAVFVNTTIVLKNVSINKMVKDKYIDEDYINNNRVTLGGLRLFYDSKSIVCEGGK